MRLLTCHEQHKRYPWESTGFSWSSADKAALLSLHQSQSLPPGAITPEYNGFSTGSHCGLLQIGQTSMEILPKIFQTSGNNKAPENRQLLVAMLGVVFDLPTWQEQDAKSGTDEHLLPFLIRAFLRETEFQLERGLYKTYEVHEDRLIRPRGRLMFPEMLRNGSISAPGLICEFDELTIDNPYNQAIFHALACARRAFSGAHRLAVECERMFSLLAGISKVPKSPDQIAKLPRNRLSARYDRVLQLASWVIRAMGPDVNHGEQNGLSLLFDMNKLFEEYVGRICQSVAREHYKQIRLQGPERPLAMYRDNKGESSAFNLKPDIVVSSGGKHEMVVDTKWKRLEHFKSHDGVTTADIYQMHAYARRYGVGEVVLLYPHHLSLVKDVGRWQSFTVLDEDESKSRHKITIATLDLHDLSTVPDQIRKLLFPDACGVPS